MEIFISRTDRKIILATAVLQSPILKDIVRNREEPVLRVSDEEAAEQMADFVLLVVNRIMERS